MRAREEMDCKGDVWVIGDPLHTKSLIIDGAPTRFDTVDLDMRSLYPQPRGVAVPYMMATATRSKRVRLRMRVSIRGGSRRIADNNMEPLTLGTSLRLVFGCVVLLAGRNVFWLFVGLMGFLVGVEFAEIWLADEPRLLVIATAAGAGLLGALLAVLYQRVAFALAGFTAMAYLAIVLAEKIGIDSAQPAIVFVTGLVGAILAVLIVDWAIIVLSSLAGAAAIVSTLTTARTIDAAVFVILAAIGISVQHSVLARRRRP